MSNHRSSRTPDHNRPHKLPINSDKRLAALHKHDVNNHQSRADLNDIVRLTTQLCEAPIARVTLVDRDRQRFVAHTGSAQQTATLDDGFCPMVVLRGETLVVNDATADPWFLENRMVKERGVRFYAGVPLITSDGYVIGAVCVMDYDPRELTPLQLSNLEAIARQTMRLLALKMAQREITQADHTLMAVSEGVAAEVGRSFFPVLVEQITAALCVDYAYIALLSAQKPGVMETLVVCHQGKLVDNFEYELSRAPCFDVLKAGEFCYHGRNVQQLYPEEPSIQALGIEGYAAVPIMDVSGQPLGVLATMNTQVMSNPEGIKALLTIFSVRISAELERQKDEVSQRELLIREKIAREQAELANRMKDDFLAVVSHELRSPLNPIIGWSKLLRRGTLSPKKVDAALETIERNALLQVRLVDDLLDVSRILRGKLSLNKVPINIGSVVAASIKTIRLEANHKDIDIQQIDLTEAPAELCVLGDEVRLQQIFGNLLSNAVKFTPNGGRITVRLSVQEGSASVQIQDTGKGISADFLPNVFDRFRQEDYSTTRQFGGLGIGLAIVRQLVAMHSGSVSASSPGEGQGATFIVQIPLIN